MTICLVERILHRIRYKPRLEPVGPRCARRFPDKNNLVSPIQVLKYLVCCTCDSHFIRFPAPHGRLTPSLPPFPDSTTELKLSGMALGGFSTTSTEARLSFSEVSLSYWGGTGNRCDFITTHTHTHTSRRYIYWIMPVLSAQQI